MDAILIATEWEEFRNLDWDRLRKIVSHPLIVDGRNMFNGTDLTSRGFHYSSIGRQPAFSSDEDSSTDPAAELHAAEKEIRRRVGIC